jgi:hypothetical protein
MAHRNILEAPPGGTDAENVSDIVIIAPYELPQSTADGVIDAWCALLNDTEGCDETPADPLEPASLPTGLVFAKLRGSVSGTLYTQPPVPVNRISYAFVTLYLEPGHGLEWGAAANAADPLEVCIETTTNPSVFNPPGSDCELLNWATVAADTATQLEELGETLVGTLLDMEALRSVAPGTFVSNIGKINLNGQVFTREQVLAYERVIPDVFQSGSTPLGGNDTYVPPTQPPQLSESIRSTVTASTYGQDVEAVSQEFFGMDGLAAATFGMVILGIGVAGLVYGPSGQNAGVSMMAFIITMIAGAFWSSPEIHMVAGAIMILLIPASFWLFGRVES